MTAAASPYRVVIADDVALLRRLYRAQLEASGRFVVVGEAEDGEEALALATSHQPDLTILDLAMPVMDGLEALPLIRAAVPRGAVVVLSSAEEGGIETEVRDRGADAFVAKDRAARSLIEALLRVLGERETAEAGPVSHREVTSTFPQELSSAPGARRFLLQTLANWAWDGDADAAALLITELVTNAVVHAESAADVRLELRGDVLRVEVVDHGGGALVRREVEPAATGGRGLFLVERMSTSWGTVSVPGEKLVWFEIEPEGAPAAN